MVEPEAEVDPLIGQVFCRRFEIVAPIAAGGMGKIYRAIQRPLDRLVALKVLNPRFDAPSFEERFFIEALMTAKLRHPNTVTLLDYGRSDEGIYFMALELIEGESLQQLLVRNGPLPWPRALIIGAQVARALREAHLLGLVHRDLKPGNIMVLPEGALGDRVKVLDFGLVKCVESLAEVAREEAGGLTGAGVVLGSPLYMAPEQARKEVDLRSDIYSLGAVLFAAMAGRTPFLGKKSLELLLKHMREAPPRLATLADVPDDVDALVMKCLAKAPEGRFQTMDEFLLAVHRVVRAHDLGGVLVEVAKTPAPTSTEVLPPPLPAGAARTTPVSPRRGLLLTPRRWSRPCRWSVFFGLGLVALTSVFAATAPNASPAHAEAVPALDSFRATSDVVPAASLGLEPIEEGPQHQLDGVPPRGFATLPSRPLFNRRAADRVAKPAAAASPKATTASLKRVAPPILRNFRNDPYE